MSKKLTTLCALSAVAISVSAMAAPTKVNVYTEDFFGADWGPGAEVKAAFEKAHSQCQVQYQVFDSRNVMLNRLRLEKQKTKADVVLGLDNFQFESAEKTGLFAETPVDISKLNLPIKWNNKLFVPYEFGQFAFIYDKNKLTNPPKSLKEIVDNQNLRVIYQDPRTSSMGRGFTVLMNKVYSPAEIKQAWQTLAKHTVTVGKGWTETYGAFLKGEADLVFSHSTSPIYHLLNEQKDNYAAVEVAEGAVYQYDTVAKVAGKNNACADQFIQFLFTPEAQKVIIPKNVMLSAISGEIEPHFDALKAAQFKEKALDTGNISDAEIKAWTTEWQNAVAK